MDLFQERYRELPIFQKYMDLLKDAIFEDEYSLQELATRLMMASENGLNWDTLCMNCGVLMDHNYAFAMQNAQLKEDLAYAETSIRDLKQELRSARHDNNQF
jgi:hypothetical protein